MHWVDSFQWNWRLRAWVTILAPPLATTAAVVWAARNGLHTSTIVVTGLMYLATMFGLTAGYHRYLTHASFNCVRPLKWLLTVLGCMAAQGPPLFWVAIHRLHHQHSDSDGDPHSPILGEGRLAALTGLAHAHVGWMLEPINLPNYARLLPDLLRDRDVVRIGRWYVFWVLAGIIAPGLCLLSITKSSDALIEGILFGGFLRILLVHHAIWSVNSLGHRYGSRPYATRDGSGNLAWLAVPTLGDAWHNNHHAFPYSARQGLTRWQLDINYLILRGLRRFGMVWNLKSPVMDRSRHPAEAMP
jgi:stearoyl-CoA desaturase (Delta-9 desaturase)